MAQYPAAVTTNNNEKFRSFKSKENIDKKEVGHTTVSAIKASSVTIQTWQKEPVEKYCKVAIFNMAVVSKSDISRKISKCLKFA